MRRAAMSSTGAITEVIVLLLVATVVHGQAGWGVSCSSSQQCALNGSDVQIYCSYSHPSKIGRKDLAVGERFWFRNLKNGIYEDLEEDLSYSNRVKYDCYNNNKSCILTITNLTETDSAVYKFRFTTNHIAGKYTGEPGVTLHVTDLKVQERTTVTGSHNSVWLECQSSCDLPHGSTYIWHNNGQEVSGQASKYFFTPLHQGSRISCCVTGGKSCSPSFTPNVDWRVSSTKICAFKGSTVKIQCGYSRTNTRDTNFSEFCSTTLKGGRRVNLNNDIDFRGRVMHYCGKNYCNLSISDLRDSDSADYKFRFTSNQGNLKYSPGVTLSVTDPQLQVDVKKYYNGINLTCHSNCQLPEGVSYIWYNNGQKSTEEKNLLVDKFSITGNYQCAAQGHDQFPSPVVYAPMSPSVLSPSGEKVEGRPVNLTCSSDANPAAKYTWYKNGDVQPVSQEPYLIFNPIQSSDSGQYNCTAENDLGINITRISIDVKYSPKPPSVSVSPSGEIVEGSSVTLTCESKANPVATYTWYKDNQSDPFRREGDNTFSSISSGDSGTYFCKSENSFGSVNSAALVVDVLYAPKFPFLSVSHSGDVVEGKSVTLSCRSDANPAANYTWYKTNKDSPTASGQNFTINNTRLEDSGNYFCEAENRMGSNLSVIHLTVIAVYPQALKITIGITTVIFLTIVLLYFFLLLSRKKRPRVPSLQPSLGHVHEERPGNREQDQISHLENQEDLHYASVRFTRNKTDPIYCNIKQAGACRAKVVEEEEEEEEDVVYTTVRVTSSGPRNRDQPREDPNALYSVVKKS